MSQKRIIYRLVSFLLQAFLLAACSPMAKPQPTATSTSVPTSTITLIPTPTITATLIPTPVPTMTPFPESFNGSVQIGSFTLSMSCVGKGEPTIILENGLDTTSWNDNDTKEIRTITRTCQYLRLGMSHEYIPGPRTTQDQVNDLHALLTGLGVPGPYILVGHSIAGFNMILYTNQYPKDVVGLVCVECRYPMFDQIFMKKLGPPSPNESGIITVTRIRENIIEDDWHQFYEDLDIRTSDQQVLKVTSLGDRPFIVMVAQTRGDEWGDATMNQLSDESWLEANGILSKLSTRGRIIEVPNTDHMSILNSDKIFTAIQEVYTAVKSRQS
jgi:hypothetical protein